MALDLVTSEFILAELERTLKRPSFAVRLAPDGSDALLVLLREHAEVVVPDPVAAPGLVDPADLPVIGTAIAGAADLLVTGDAAMLQLREHAGIKIVSPRTALAML